MKNKTIGMISFMTVMLFAFATTTLGVGDFVIQNSAFTQIFTVNGTTNATFSIGEIYENSSALKTVYWQIANVATPSDGDTSHLSTGDQIYDYIAGLSYVANAWDALTDMELNDTYIYVGDGSDQPVGVVVSGGATITNLGVVTIVDSSHVHAGENITSGTVAAARIDATMATDAEVAAFEFFDDIANFTGTLTNANWCIYNQGTTEIDCNVTAVSDTTYTADIPLNLTGTVFGLIDCADTEIYKFNSTADVWECEADAGAGISNVVEDTTPQLGGNLDVNDFGIDGGGNTNMTIDATGNFIIVLA